MGNGESPTQKHYLGHRERLRTRFLENGAESLQEYELVELLLTYCLPQMDVKPIAKELLSRFGSIKGIFDANEEDLEKVPYIKDKFIVLLKLIREMNAVYRKQKIEGSSSFNSLPQIAEYCIEKFGFKEVEEFHVLFLNSKFEIISSSSFPTKEFYLSGTAENAPVYPRKIIEEGLKKKAYAFVLAHNHPNGVLQPSEADINSTKLVALAAQSLEMMLLDHIIVTQNGYFSFRKGGII